MTVSDEEFDVDDATFDQDVPFSVRRCRYRSKSAPAGPLSRPVIAVPDVTVKPLLFGAYDELRAAAMLLL